MIWSIAFFLKLNTLQKDCSFFKFDQARNEFQKYHPKIERVDMAVYYAGYDTYFGEAHSKGAFKAQNHKEVTWIESRVFPTMHLEIKN